jgi:hypothetical protein
VRARPAAAALVFVTSLALPAYAYRPFDSTDASVAEHGELELELGPANYARARGASFYAPTAIVNLGFCESWEVVVQGREYVLVGRASGETRGQLVDTGAFVKGVLREGALQNKSGPSVATEIGVLLPTINGEAGQGGSAAMIVSERWSFATIHLNLQATRTRAVTTDGFLGVIVEGPYAWRLRPVAELWYDEDFDANAHGYSALLGGVARVRDGLTVDAATRLAREGDVTVFEVRAGLTWALPLWKPR